MTVMAPSSHQEVGEMLATALAQADGPVAIRWPKTAAMSSRICGAGLGARKLADGGDACLLGVGKLVEACLEAAVELAAEGVRASVWDVRLASPLDPAMLADAMGHPVVVTAEDGIAAGGVGTHVADALARMRLTAGGRRDCNPVVLTCGLPTEYIAQGRPADILALYGLDGHGLGQATLRALASRGA
jgi:1-deoxy-D-xylulose-5-phosphate synthase